MAFITIKHTWEAKYITEIPLETNPFNRKATFKLLLITVWKQGLKFSSGSLLCSTGCLKHNKFSPLPIWCEICSKEKCLFLCQLARVITGRESCTCFEWLLRDTLSSKQENLLLLATGRNVCLLIERDDSREEYGKLLIWGSSSPVLLKEMNLQFMVVEVACNCGLIQPFVTALS